MLKLSKFSSLSKQLRQKNVKKKGTGWFFGDISNHRDLVQTFFPIKENVASEMEYSLAWISNPDVESCQIATETIKIEKNDQGLTQISAVSVTERQNHWSTPNIKWLISTSLSWLLPFPVPLGREGKRARERGYLWLRAPLSTQLQSSLDHKTQIATGQ